MAITRPRGYGRLGLLPHLIALVLAVLLPALALGILAAGALVDSYRSAFETRLSSTARAVALALDESLGAHLALGEALAAAPSLISGDYSRFEGQARTAAAALDSWVLLVGPGPDYRRILHTALPPGHTPAYGGLVLPEQEAPIPRVFATAEATISNVGTGHAHGRPTALVLTPVRRGGAVAEVLAIGFRPERVARLLEAQQLTGELVATAIDGAGRIVARSRQHAIYAGQHAPAWFREQVSSAPNGTLRGPSLEGEEMVVAVARLRQAPWAVAISAPAAAEDAAALEPVLVLAGGGIMLLALATTLALWLAQRIRRPVATLAHAASDIAIGRVGSLAAVPPAPIAEIEILRRALVDAEATREEREARERSEAARQKVLVAELSHRVKNALAVVQAALRLTSRSDPASYAAAVEGRVAALARASALLAETGWEGAELTELLRAELAPFRDAGGAGPRVILSGPPVWLASVAVQPLAIVLHELATNAVKHGALSVAEGRLDVSWRREPDGALTIDWRERGAPVAVSGRVGFGTRVLETTMRSQLQGSLERDWRPDGLAARLRVPPAMLAG